MMCLFMLTLTANAQEPILGPYLWMFVKLAQDQGGQLATNVDSLAAASNNTVTEDVVAKNGATEGDTVGDYQWTFADLPDNGNINDVAKQAGFTEVDLDDVTSYALYTYTSDKDQEATMKTGSDDSIKVWLNGEVVFTNATNRGAARWQDEFGISLKQGDNLLMIKVSDRGGGWGMHAGILETPFVAPIPIVEITTNWLWTMVKLEANQGGQLATDVDSLSAATDGNVTEEKVAKEGATEGDTVGDYKWTLADLPSNNNLNDLVNQAGIAEGGFDDVTAYGLVTLVAAEDMENVAFVAGSDDSIKVWLNGEVIHTNAVNRGTRKWDDEFTGNLKKGNNLLMVKVSDRGGGWGVAFGIRGTVETAYLPGDQLLNVEAAGKFITTWGKLKGAK